MASRSASVTATATTERFRAGAAFSGRGHAGTRENSCRLPQPVRKEACLQVADTQNKREYESVPASYRHRGGVNARQPAVFRPVAFSRACPMRKFSAFDST